MSRPPPARTAATAEKWGSASFKRICNRSCKSPKRRLSPPCDSDDPFSFDSDDDNIAKKSRKENVGQKTSASVGTQHAAGHYSVAAKPRNRMMNCKEKSSAGDAVEKKHQPTGRRDESRGKQYVEKMTRCRTSVKAQHKSDRESNGVSSYYTATATMSGRGDSLETQNEMKCQSSRLDADNKLSSPTGTSTRSPTGTGARSPTGTGTRNTRSTDVASSCKTTQQLKVFVDNFSQLISSQRSSPNKRSRASTDGKLLPASGQHSATKDVTSCQNCDSELGDMQSSTVHRLAHQAVNSSSALHSHQDSDDDDDDDDEVSVVVLSRKTDTLRATHRASDTPPTTTNSRKCSSTKATSRISADSSPTQCIAESKTSKNEVTGSKLGHLRSHRWRVSDERTTGGIPVNKPHPATATAAAATAAAASSSAVTTTGTRRLLTGSCKVSSHLMYS